MDYGFLLTISIILLSTKFLGGISEKVHMPQVVGALIAGVILGPSVLGFAEETDFLSKTAEVGVILLMFMAGLDTDISEIKKNSLSFVVIAACGVIVPLIMGAAAYFFYFHIDPSDKDALLHAIFVGVILTATSVSITVEALREMGKLDSPVGNAILGAAVIDDIMGIIILTLIFSLKDPNISIISILFKITLYAIMIATMGFFIHKKSHFFDNIHDTRRFAVYIMAFLMLISFITEIGFGIADITGAYLFGLCLSSLKIKTDIAKKMTIPSYIIFSPIFFASIGIKTELNGLTKSLLIFAFILLAVAIISKIIGCSIGARLCKYTSSEALNIGIGMVSRGEVALIVAQKGYAMGLLDKSLFSPIVLVVIITTVITPIILKQTLKHSKLPSC